MKRIFLIGMGLLAASMLVAQSPAAFRYQAVVRDASGNIISNQNVSFRISILEGGVSGSVVLQETHLVATNEFGLVNLEIGNGQNISGNLGSIGWGDATHHLKIEIDPNGGSAFTFMGTTQLLSVPYALHARTVQYDQVNDDDADPYNEIQELQLSGTVLTLTRNGGSVTLPTSGGGDNWGTQVVLTDATLSGSGTTAAPLTIADNGVNSAKIENGSILTEDLADQSVTSPKLGNLSVGADNIQNGAVTGTKIAQGGAASGQVMKWNGTTWAPGTDLTGSGLWQQSATNIFYNDGYVGIGTSTPHSLLHLHSTGVGTSLLLTNDASGNTFSDGLVIGHQYQNDEINKYAAILNNENSPLVIGTNGDYYQFIILPDGSVGIGTQQPTTKLDVNGQVRIRGGSPGSGKILTSDATGLATWQSPSGGLTLPFEGSASSLSSTFQVNNTGMGTAITGSAESTSSSNVGVYGQSKSVSGIGVFGVATAETGTTYGVYGLTYSETGRGTVGWANSTTGVNFGVRGFSASSSGIGVDGQATSTSGVNYGVRGHVFSTTGYSGAFYGGRFFVEGKTGIGVPEPDFKLDVAGDRIRLANGGEWIALRTDGSPGFLDLSYSGGKLVIQGSAADENVIINPSMNKVGIRTWLPQYDLDVNGDIRAIGSVYYGGSTGSADGTAYIKPDYVFDESYERLDPENVEDFLARENHLPWITSAKQEKIENGENTNMTRMAFETLEAVENVQLQVIRQDKQIRELKAENRQLKSENKQLKKRLDRIEKLLRQGR
jgi:hypothetical protein